MKQWALVVGFNAVMAICWVALMWFIIWQGTNGGF